MDDQTVYESYVKFSKLVGSPVLDFEGWSRKRYADIAVENSADGLREKWLASEADVKMRPPTRAAIEKTR